MTGANYNNTPVVALQIIVNRNRFSSEITFNYEVSGLIRSPFPLQLIKK